MKLNDSVCALHGNQTQVLRSLFSHTEMFQLKKNVCRIEISSQINSGIHLEVVSSVSESSVGQTPEWQEGEFLLTHLPIFRSL